MTPDEWLLEQFDLGWGSRGPLVRRAMIELFDDVDEDEKWTEAAAFWSPPWEWEDDNFAPKITHYETLAVAMVLPGIPGRVREVT